LTPFIPDLCSDPIYSRIALHKITQDVRDYAAKQGMKVEVALTAGMKEKAEVFKKKGSEIYLKN